MKFVYSAVTLLCLLTLLATTTLMLVRQFHDRPVEVTVYYECAASHGDTVCTRHAP